MKPSVPMSLIMSAAVLLAPSTPLWAQTRDRAPGPLITPIVDPRLGTRVDDRANLGSLAVDGTQSEEPAEQPLRMGVVPAQGEAPAQPTAPPPQGASPPPTTGPNGAPGGGPPAPGAPAVTEPVGSDPSAVPNGVDPSAGVDSRQVKPVKSGGIFSGSMRRMRKAGPAPAFPPTVAPVAPSRPGQGTVPAVVTTPLAPSAVGTLAKGTVELPGEREFNSCKKLPPGKRIVKLNFKPEMEIVDLIGLISSISCAQFLIPQPSNLTGKKLTIISPQLITPDEAYRLFLAAIDSVGFTVEPTGKYLRIIEIAKAKSTALPFLRDTDRLPNDKSYVTRLIRVENVDANEVITQVLNRLKSEQGDLIGYGTSTIIVTDQAVVIERMLSVLKEIDVPQPEGDKVWMLRVKNMSVDEMANHIAEIFQVQRLGTGGRRNSQGAPAPAPPPPAGPTKGPRKAHDLAVDMSITKLIPDERTNHLIVIANEVAYQWLVAMVEKLDVPVEGGGDGRVHIYYCEYANCDELAATLGSVTGVAVSGTQGGRRSRNGAAPAAPAPTPTPNGTNQPSMLFEGEVRVTFDRPTNSLVIVSSLKDFQSLRKVIERLDGPRKQVFVEALVLEVNLDKSRQLGVNYHAGFPQNISGQESVALGGFGAAKTLQPNLSTLGSDPAVQNGLSAALFGPALLANTTQIFGTSLQLPEFGLLLTALQSNNDVNILSNPSITITNNEDGEISVGQNIPFPGAFIGAGFGGGTSTGTSLTPAVSVQRQDVALKMKLTPSINEHNMIRLDVDFEISDIAAEDFGGRGLGPSTTKRTAKTPIVTRDQQTVIIGGLMADRTSETVSKIPVLGDIPILGFLFRRTSKRAIKNNIIIALTPYIINEPGDLRRVTEKKMQERREFIERFTAFSDSASARINTDIDYRRKRGMLEEINRAARDLEEEEAALRAIRERDLQEDAKPIEPRRRGAPTSHPGAGTEPPDRSDSLGKTPTGE